jgi:hypothetical protein
MKIAKGALLAVTAAALISSTTVLAADQAASPASSVKCYGANSCKGKSACKTAHNACKGQNSCKGKGYTTVDSAKQCKAEHGSLKEPK